MALITFDGFGSDTDITAVGYTRATGSAGSLVATSAGLLKFALSSNSLYTLDTSVADHSFELEWASGSGGYDFFPLCARVTDINNMYCARVSSPNNLQLYKYVAGVQTQLGSTVVLSGRAIGDKMKIVCIGSSIQLWYAGTKRIDVTDTSHLTATKVGHFGRSTTSGGIFNTAEWLDVTPVVSLDSINGGTNSVQIGSAGNTAETTGLTTATSASLNGVAMTSVAGSSSPWTFSCPPLTDEAVSPYPSGTFSITGAEGSPTLAGVTVTLPTGLTSQVLSGTLNTTNTGVLYNFSPAAVITDQIFYPPVPTSGKYITIDAQGNIDTDYDGTTEFWHWQASTGITRSYDVITGNGGAVVIPPTTRPLGGRPIRSAVGRQIWPITPHATNPVGGSGSTKKAYGIKVSGAGTVVLRTENGDEDVTVTLAAGATLPVVVTHIRDTSTATGILGYSIF